MIALNKTIAYTAPWKHILWIALLLGILIPLLLILLEPFDANNNFAYKHIILSGYGLCIVIPILLIHPLENYIYRRQVNRWFIVNELIYITATLFIIFILSFFYHFYLLSGLSVLNAAMIWDFIRTFCLPFTPILIPLWLYLRSKYGTIEVPLKNVETTKKDQKVTIHGENKSETLTILESDFIYAHSQQNYVEVYFNDEHEVQQQLFRSTLTNIIKQLPNAWQVHRSYLVNLDYLTAVKGNARQRYMEISKKEETIPISQKYYVALKERLSNPSQSIQNKP